MQNLLSLLSTFGPLVGPSLLGLVGWLIREIREGVKEYRLSQAEQNKRLTEIAKELEWLKDFRQESRENVKTAFVKIDRHEELLHSHGERLGKLETHHTAKHSSEGA